MFGDHFYHERIKRSVGAFGSLFNNINIIRKDKSGASTSQIRVPLSFSPKRKFLEELRQRTTNEANGEDVIAITLPRMAFEYTAIRYDAMRQLPKTNAHTVAGPTSSSRRRIYTKTPYNITFDLNIYAKNHDDVLQVIEQIFPTFAPQYTISMRPLDEYPHIIDDVPITLISANFSDDYEGAVAKRRTIVYTLSFEMKIDFYGAISAGQQIIETADIELFINDPNSGFTSHETFSVTTDPSPVSVDSDYSFVETISLTSDSA
jgi:hypothetical protein